MGQLYIKTIPHTVIDIMKIVTIHYYEFGPDFVFEGESHDFWEMVYVDKGRVAIWQDKEEVILEQGQVVFHRPNEFHAIRAYGSSPNIFVISFVSSSLAMSQFEGYRTQLDRSHTIFLASMIREAEHTYLIPKNDPALRKLRRHPNAPLGGEQLIKNNLEQLLIYLLRSMSPDPLQSPTFLPVGEHPLVTAIAEYLSARWDENIRMEEVCRAFGYSRSFLSKLFQDYMGEGIIAYATGKKIEKAKELLQNKSLNITQISQKLSFDNPQYFARVFKQKCGMTPSEFRKLAHK